MIIECLIKEGIEVVCIYSGIKTHNLRQFEQNRYIFDSLSLQLQ